MAVSPIISVSCTSNSQIILQKAQEKAAKLQLQFTLFEEANSKYLLNYSDSHLELRCNPSFDGRSKQDIFKPIFVDFVSGPSGYRHAKNCTIKQPLAKAAGIKSGFRPIIFDATAGLGGDSFVLACLGCNVFLNERSTIIGSLLEDGLERASQANQTTEIVKKRMHLTIKDSSTALMNLQTKVDTVYLDPMYPHSEKSALNRKEMRVIREIVGDDSDAGTLLTTALEVAEKRVVVKRPKGAEYIDARTPHHEIKMKNSRFDVYLIHS